MTETALAYLVDEAAIVPTPQVGVSTEDLYRAVKELAEPDVLYELEWDNIDGEYLKRFGRTLPVEAWLVGVPVTEDGKRRHDKKMIIGTVQFKLPPLPSVKKTFVAGLIAELESLKEADA